MGRFNVYHHEVPYMSTRHELIKKHVGENTFYGIRFYTEGPLEHEPGDDDSAAITIWIPWTKKEGQDTSQLRTIADALINYCNEIDDTNQDGKRSLRVGRKLGKTLYIQDGNEPSDTDVCIGYLDKSEYAARVVAAVNRIGF